MRAVPTPVVVIHPAVSTVAMPRFPDAHVTGFATMAPVTSNTVAMNCSTRTWPSTMLAETGETVIPAMAGGGGGNGAVTFTTAWPLLPASVARIVVEPTASPVTVPVPFTMAMLD